MSKSEGTHLIRAVLGDPEFKNIDLISESSTCDYFRIRLDPERFHGIPDEWILLTTKVGHRSADVVISELAQASTEVSSKEAIMIVSNSPDLVFDDAFSGARNVIALDHRDLAGYDRKSRVPAQASPLAHGIRRRLPKAAALMPALTLYQGAEPVEGWRFVGRARELQRIVSSNESLMLIGPRRMGKTSLLRQAAKLLREQGDEVFFLDVQDLKTPGEVVRLLVREYDEAREKSIWRRIGEFDEKPLDWVLRRLASRSKPPVVIFDELGNVIDSAQKDNWNFFGTLRKYIHSGEVRIVTSCFQEVYLAQQANFSGPLVNFSNEMLLNPLSEGDAQKLVIDPWRFWNPIDQHELKEVRKLLARDVGTHPLFLQFLGKSLLEQMQDDSRPSVLVALKHVLRKELYRYFRVPMKGFFYNIVDPVPKYLFLRRCQQARADKQLLGDAVITEEWVDDELKGLGLESRTQSRDNMLVSMEFYGFISPKQDSPHEYAIAVPLAYRYIEKVSNPIERLIDSLASEVRSVGSKYHLKELPR